MSSNKWWRWEDRESLTLTDLALTQLYGYKAIPFKVGDLVYHYSGDNFTYRITEIDRRRRHIRIVGAVGDYPVELFTFVDSKKLNRQPTYKVFKWEGCENEN